MDAFELACQRSGYKQIAGIDEAGRGALAGPVIAAAVILPPNCGIDGLRDSKQLTPKQRDGLADEIHSVALSLGIGSADNRVIDCLNVLKATLLAMQAAIEKLTPQPDYLLVDGINLPTTDIPGRSDPEGRQSKLFDCGCFYYRQNHPGSDHDGIGSRLSGLWVSRA